jgi:uncharacterized protein YqeY
MTLIEQIRARQLQERKARNGMATAALSTLMGDADVIGMNSRRDILDSELVQLLKKFIKNAEDTKRTVTEYKNTVAVQQLETEIALYNEFLPLQLTELALSSCINDLIVAGNTNVGAIMKNLKAKYDGQYDGSLASKLIKMALTSA